MTKKHLSSSQHTIYTIATVSLFLFFFLPFSLVQYHLPISYIALYFFQNIKAFVILTYPCYYFGTIRRGGSANGIIDTLKRRDILASPVILD